MNTNSKITMSILLVAPLVATAGLLIPTPESWAGSWAVFHIPLAITMAYAWLHVGAAILFLAGTKAYKAILRYAYIALSAGIVLTAFGTLMLVVMNGFSPSETGGPLGALALVAFLLAGLTIYLGMRQLGRAVRVRSGLTRAGIVMPIVITICALSALLPHAPSVAPEAQFDVLIAITLWSSLLNFSSALIVLKIKQRIGSHYVNAMAWLVAVLVMGGVILMITLFYLLLFDGKNQVVAGIITGIGLLLGLLWLKAGYAFSRTKEV
jgi:hypothetical protein